MSLIESNRKLVVEAAELRVEASNVVNPEKLAMLAEEGWAIYTAWKLKDGGFNLLLTRPIQTGKEVPKVSHIIHEGTSRCPNYCNCLSSKN